MVKDPETYERFERVILCHGVRNAADLAYRDYIEQELPRNPYLGEIIRKQAASTTPRSRASPSSTRAA